MDVEPVLGPEALSALNDEALVRLVQAGGPGSEGAACVEAFGLLLERMTPVISARVSILAGSATPQAREDLMQEGVMGFLSAVSAYAPERGASFRTYASVCAGNRVVSALRRSGAAAREVPLTESDLPVGIAMDDPQEIFFAMEETRRMAELIRDRLTDLERGVLEAFLAGERYEAIAKQMGIGAKTVDNALQRVRKKLQQLRE